MDMMQAIAALIWAVVIARALFLMARTGRSHAPDVARV